jgi:hypothetical protein
MTVNLREDISFIKNSPKKFAQRSTIQHWQLRDLVLCPTDRKKFVYVNGNSVNFYDTSTQTVIASP